jgi:hypothetical protein
MLTTPHPGSPSRTDRWEFGKLGFIRPGQLREHEAKLTGAQLTPTQKHRERETAHVRV